jgi:hypothetical protein
MTHPTIACGPPIAAMNSGIVMNGPIPTMLATFSDAACNSPSPRSRRTGSARTGSADSYSTGLFDMNAAQG